MTIKIKPEVPYIIKELFKNNPVPEKNAFWCWEQTVFEKVRCIFTTYCLENRLDSSGKQELLDEIFRLGNPGVSKAAFELFMRKYL